MMYYLIQTIGIVGAVVAFVAFQQKQHKRIVAFRAVTDCLFTFHWLLQSAWVGTAMGIVCVIKDLILAFAVEKNRHVKLCTVLLCALYIAMGAISIVFSNDSIAIGVLLIAANLNGTVAYSISNEILMRMIDLPTEVVWLVYNLRAMSFGGITCQTFIIISILIVFIRFSIKKLWRREDDSERKRTTTL